MRHVAYSAIQNANILFLTSKVRLHCDQLIKEVIGLSSTLLFLTSKVRLHCDKEEGSCFGVVVAFS